MRVTDYIQNRSQISLDEQFTAIVGLNPSSGARSPALWNAVLDKNGIAARMCPLDVLEADVPAAMRALETDPRFLGGAVTLPHKESISHWLGHHRLTQEARRIGAVNCLFRDTRGNLCGTNTDGEAALACFLAKHGSVEDKVVFQLGCGGAGKAVAAYFSAAGARVALAVRNVGKITDFAKTISATAVAWNDFDRLAGQVDIVINTTDVGFSDSGKGDQTPLSVEQVAKLKPDAVVYDVVYKPDPTALLAIAAKRKLSVMGGGCMNLEQAAIGFGYCFPKVGNHNETRKIMLAEKAQLGW